jgi:hypothetical protein
LLSLGGRLVLLNSVISTIPLYYITLFKIPCWVLIKIDHIRKRFLWAGSDITSRKYHLVRWEVICRLKEFGGWGGAESRIHEYIFSLQMVLAL